MSNMHALIVIGFVVVILIAVIAIYHSIQSALDADRDDPDIWRDD